MVIMGFGNTLFQLEKHEKSIQMFNISELSIKSNKSLVQSNVILLVPRKWRKQELLFMSLCFPNPNVYANALCLYSYFLYSMLKESIGSQEPVSEKLW